MNYEESQICHTCYQIQDACNFMPVCAELLNVLVNLKEAGVNHQMLPTHPAVIILVDKINDMMGRPDLDTVMRAFAVCREPGKVSSVIDAEKEQKRR